MLPDGGRAEAGAAAAGAQAVCAYGRDLPELKFPTAEVSGTLKGQSRNPSTTCTRQKSAGGPESIYVLRVAQRSVIDLEVTSNIDTVIAVRTTCDDPLTEVACNDTAGESAGNNDPSARLDAGVAVRDAPVRQAPGTPPQPTSPSAGPTPPGTMSQPSPPVPPPGSSRDGAVRVVLDPGLYYVLVDEAEPFGVGGAYTLSMKSAPPPAEASCATAVSVMNGSNLQRQALDLAGEKHPACGAATPRPALFYKARIPSGERFTARVRPAGGDRAWAPNLQLFSACTSGTCLASGRLNEQGEHLLRYVNNAADAVDVLLSVSASTAVAGAMFDLSVGIGPPVQNFTCASATPVVDGTQLVNQDLSEGQASFDNQMCKPTGGPSLFYRATLLPEQRFVATLTHRNPFGPPPMMTLTEGCGQLCLFGGSDRIEYQNIGDRPKTVILEVSTFPGAPPVVFDLAISMPLPPGGIKVQPTSPLVTSEAGGQATFEVALSAPPGKPVTIPLESSDPKEGTPAPAALTFDGQSWDKPQRVTVTGVNDDVADGLRSYQILLRPAASEDPRYAGMDGPDVDLKNRDDEPGFFVNAPPVLLTVESGTKATFTVELNRAPTAPVQLPIASSKPSEGVPTPSLLTFTPDDWQRPQTVTVTGVDDMVNDSAQSYSIVLGPARSADPAYEGADPPDLPARNSDDDYEQVPARVVSGALTCFVGAGEERIAVDEGGTLYVVMTCGGKEPIPPPVPMGFGADAGPLGGQPGVFVVASEDGGRTFSAPVALDVTFPNEVTIVAGQAGTAYVASISRDLTVRRTHDGGRTWHPPVTLVTGGAGNVRATAAGSRVVVGAHHMRGVSLWRNERAGEGAFTEANVTRVTEGGAWRMSLDGSDNSLWIVSMRDRAMLSRSTDGGSTFGMPVFAAEVKVFAEAFAFGGGFVFGVGGDSRVLAFPLANPEMARAVGDLSFSLNFPRSLAADVAGNLTVVDNRDGVIELVRLAPGASAFSGRRTLTAAHGPPSAVALSPKAVAITYVRDGQVFAGVETWP